MFKLAEDPMLPPEKVKGLSRELGPRHLYGGYAGPCHEFAAKSASHELKGANQMFRTGWERLSRIKGRDCANGIRRIGLRVPMMVMIDYCGFRVTARPWLALQPGSMVYGYDARARRMQGAQGNPEVRNLLKECAEKLHLCKHISFGVPIYTGGDVEVHKGEMSRLYVLDATRTFPCESSQIANHLYRRGQPEFFRMLRPEFLQILKARHFPPLNPDGFTGTFQSLCATGLMISKILIGRIQHQRSKERRTHEQH